MKKTSLILILLTIMQFGKAQNLQADFENFTLQANSYYKDTNSVWFETTNISFMYEWTKGSFPYWSGGFSYTNRYDSSTAGFTNLYGVKPLKGHNGSSMYIVGQSNAKLRLKAAQTIVQGFYYTNTTYAYKSIKNGDSFSRKFGDTTGTGSGGVIGQGSYPDYFKLIVRGYRNGALLADSVVIFLADYRSGDNSQDFVVNDWRYANTSTLGVVDSLVFLMRSSDNDQYGMLTPGFFGIDDFITSSPAYVGLSSLQNNTDLSTFPNPFKDQIYFNTVFNGRVAITDLSGRKIYENNLQDVKSIELSFLQSGVYLMQLENTDGVNTMRIIKD